MPEVVTDERVLDAQDYPEESVAPFPVTGAPLDPEHPAPACEDNTLEPLRTILPNIVEKIGACEKQISHDQDRDCDLKSHAAVGLQDHQEKKSQNKVLSWNIETVDVVECFRPAVEMILPVPFSTLDSDGSWLSRSRFCVLTAGGSQIFVEQVCAVSCATSADSRKVAFYYETRLPANSIIVLSFKQRRCCWIPDHSREGAAPGIAQRLLTRLVENEGLELPVPFESEDFINRSFGACLGVPHCGGK